MPKSKISHLALFSALSALTLAAPIKAQSVLGSGVPASTVPNSTERPIAFAEQAPADAGLVILMQGAELPDIPALSSAERSALEAAINSADFKGKTGTNLELRGIGSRPLIMLAGAAQSDDEGPDWKSAAGSAVQKLMKEGTELALVGAPDAAAMADAALGLDLGQYRFDRYQTDNETAPASQQVIISGPQASAAQSLWNSRHKHLADSVRMVRDLQSEPANTLYPQSFVDRVSAAFKGVPNIRIEILDEAAMRKMNMGAIVGVGQGSPRGSRMMVVRYTGGSGAPLALAGKGITFDTGGISIKPNKGMWAMKADMSGAAAVMGATLSLAKSRAPVNIVAIAALAENMPGANAQRPGDVVRTYGGKTIEILSTDAEGRLVLADAVQYVADRYKPFALVDIATLTGSVGRAVGDQYAGLFAREDAIADRLLKAADDTGEHLWRLPLHPAYAKAIRSDIADVKNSGVTDAPGASAGAHFIGYFIDESMPWAHLDIAGVDWNKSAKPLTPKGASGFGVRLLDQLARDWTAK
ncbi:leucyl aminopeptidase [Parasphingorhabdus cellanae]|uniref:Probable cytosol aminopeptidase n=1 Tax=Parasphingorhabdus cellanae TaxID=2806553 RepID=A0ABX7TA03_9SPHN|nr:leucyl aminopeptidase [Parasphingorhabdus cellanae]QTD56968.1 leucyl aminopeptidase [Parasphingorhabdus cellanae]